MNTSTTAAVIFVAVWLLVVLLYCVFRACGGRLVDVFTCSWLSGPCCSCWGVGGRIYRDDLEYPFHDDGYRPYDPNARGQLPVIVINNGGGSGGGSSSSEGEEESEEAAALRELQSRDPEGRVRAEDALLLRNRSRTDPESDGGPIVV